MIVSQNNMSRFAGSKDYFFLKKAFNRLTGIAFYLYLLTAPLVFFSAPLLQQMGVDPEVSRLA